MHVNLIKTFISNIHKGCRVLNMIRQEATFKILHLLGSLNRIKVGNCNNSAKEDSNHNPTSDDAQQEILE